ncbi:PREDICTED: uncharacterized protein LOC109224226 [Nicotiana attenuata]|uniref:uncharacterized protein LOC109224226 n=1 Tax=Nicotiana attenuata TaxID=49451 RepID=UPI0009058ADA|nr:PREDICTED: uncharacterized protein LOC109224226 [Nicotiana attenuata]
MNSFSEIIDDLDLIDLPLQGAQYTWSRGETSLQASRIDRFLFSSEWNETFKSINQVALPRVLSNHKPILLENGDWEATSSYFKIDNMWLQAEGFMDRETFGKIEARRNKALDELRILDQISEIRIQTPKEKLKAFNLKVELQQIATAEETSWRQKSRCLWLKEGDKNTKYFQRMANYNRRSNIIDRLKIGDETIEDKALIKKEILEFYQNMYNESEPWRPDADFEGISTLSMEEKDELESSFVESEVLEALKSCAPDVQMGSPWVSSKKHGISLKQTSWLHLTISTIIVTCLGLAMPPLLL